MKIGIYISGLGQSFVEESVEKYACRLMNEISFNTNGKVYELKTEKITYTTDRESNVVSICEKGDAEKVIYKFYDFKYHEILTEKFNSCSLILKNLWLFLFVIKKIPILINRIFKPSIHNRPFQTFYLFFIFLIIALAVLLMLPATISLFINFFNIEIVDQFLVDFKHFIGKNDIPFISKIWVENISKGIVSITALLLLLVPNANLLIANLATEFICANDYMQYGVQKQLLHGNLDHLVDYISENENDCKIHFHTYSFGSILALDYIYPFGNKVSKNAEIFSEAIITIGTPFEFIKSYYKRFYQSRITELGDKLIWINVYSIADILATNFRNDSNIGDAEFGIDKNTLKPININYEVAPINNWSLGNFLFLYNIKVHGMYWDNKTEGQSCLRQLYEEMNRRNLV